MKIIVIARTRNESRNIEKFCKSYFWADDILIADGGSDDDTVHLALQFENVSIEHYKERVTKDGGKTWRNPHGRHINFMIRWAESKNPDWIIFDDVDCFPNKFLVENFDGLFKVDADVILVNRIYLYGTDFYFDKQTLPSGDWEGSTSLYAWRGELKMRAKEDDPWEHDLNFPQGARVHKFSPPVCCLHDYYPDDIIRKEKVKFYRESGEQQDCLDPLDYAGERVPIEPWMKYYNE